MSDDVPRPARLNNPGDIEKGAPWLGLTVEQPDPRFCAFETPAHGFRALCKILLSYQREHRLETVRAMINRWAPASENDTEAYIALVSDSLSVGPDIRIDLTSAPMLAKFAFAISLQEAGHRPDRTPWFTPDQAAAGARMALT